MPCRCTHWPRAAARSIAAKSPLNLTDDERGAARAVGVADIRAYEREANDDELFYGGFN